VSNWANPNNWFTDEAMESSNTGLDSIELSISTTGSPSLFLTTTKPFPDPMDTSQGVTVTHDDASISRGIPPPSSNQANEIVTPSATSSGNTSDPNRKIYVCNIDNCSRSYKHPKSLRERKQAKHLKKRYMCAFAGCTKSVAQKKNLRRHKETKRGLILRG
jgi:hypothetical protein